MLSYLLIARLKQLVQLPTSVVELMCALMAHGFICTSRFRVRDKALGILEQQGVLLHRNLALDSLRKFSERVMIISIMIKLDRNAFAPRGLRSHVVG